jgi:hypothetical protein
MLKKGEKVAECAITLIAKADLSEALLDSKLEYYYDPSIFNDFYCSN